ncbi:MAG: transposase [Gammaproteobacteria bacterium]|nr:transposase [Gammaproteobacteria bacterium]
MVHRARDRSITRVDVRRSWRPRAQEAEKAKEAFQRWCCSQGFHSAAEILDHDWERMVSFYRYPKEHWVHLRTTNPIESPFAAVRL